MDQPTEFSVYSIEEFRIPFRRRYIPFELPLTGEGYLAGEFPEGITTIDGVPSPATIRVLLRTEKGHPGDGSLVVETESRQDGTWRVDGLNPELRYDVVGRAEGFNDVIIANVQPEVE